MLFPIRSRSLWSCLLLVSVGACERDGATQRAGAPTVAAAPRADDSEPAAVGPKSAGIRGVIDDAKAGQTPRRDAKAIAAAGDSAGARAHELHPESHPQAEASGTGAADGASADGASAPAAPPSKPPSSALVLEHFFWAEPVRDKAIIDIIDASDPASGADDPVLRLSAAHPMADGLEQVLPADAALPDGFARGDRWVVITADGEKRGQAVAFGAGSGASEVHFMVVLDTSARGLAVRGRDWTGPAATLRPAEAVDLSRGTGKTLLQAVGAGFVAAATGEAKRILRRRPLAPANVQIVPGRFPGGFTYLVSLTRKRRPGADMFEEHVSAFALADATGRLKVIIPPDLSIDSYEVFYLVDLNADGQDEFIWRSTYYEGSYTMLSLWDDKGQIVGRLLTGDGA